MTARSDVSPALIGVLDRLAGVERLLIVVDVDGTIAEIAPRPEDARVLASAPRALESLAALPQTWVAVVSGRSYDDLGRMLPPLTGVRVVGSHGAERDGPATLDPRTRTLRDELVALVTDAANGTPGAIPEVKPTGAALHVRLAEPEVGAAALDALARRAAALPGVHLRTGKQVLELSVVGSGKADCVRDLRADVVADAVMVLGDDDTDEEAFEALGAADLGVRVGSGPTAAAARVAGPEDVVLLLDTLARRRTAARASER